MTPSDDYVGWYFSHSWVPATTDECVLVRQRFDMAPTFKAARLSCSACGTISVPIEAGVPVGVDFSARCGDLLARKVIDS